MCCFVVVDADVKDLIFCAMIWMKRFDYPGTSGLYISNKVVSGISRINSSNNTCQPSIRGLLIATRTAWFLAACLLVVQIAIRL